jgi:hypothetical protein
MPETNQSAHPTVSLYCLQMIKGKAKFYFIFHFLAMAHLSTRQQANW